MNNQINIESVGISIALGGFKKPPPGAVSIFGPMSSPFIPTKRDPSPVEPTKNDSVCILVCQ